MSFSLSSSNPLTDPYGFQPLIPSPIPRYPIIAAAAPSNMMTSLSVNHSTPSNKPHRVLAVYSGPATSRPGGIPPKPRDGDDVVRLVIQSDTHQKWENAPRDSVFIPDGDVYAHCGDFSYTGTKKELECFANYVAGLPHPHKVVIAGNHEVTLDENYTGFLRSRVAAIKKEELQALRDSIKRSPHFRYLEDEPAEIAGIKFYGSPYTPEFCRWAFALQGEEESREKWSAIPDDTEVLLTHGPPYGVLDLCVTGNLAGDRALLRAVTERVQPLVHCFGHIHEAPGVHKLEIEDRARGRKREIYCCNVSSIDKSYTSRVPPTVIDFIRC